MPRRRFISLDADASLAEWGAILSEPPPPTQLLVWRGEQFLGATAHLDGEGWWAGEVYFAGNCLAATEPGTRAAIYQTGEGIAAMWDFSGPAVRVRDAPRAHMAAGTYRPMPRAISRAALVGDQAVHDRFVGMVARGSLKSLQSAAIDRMARAIGLPYFVRFTPPAWATDAGAVLDWTMDPDTDWGREHPIQMRVGTTRRLWSQLGFTSRPLLEQRSADGRFRFDLLAIDDRIVAEVKYAAVTTDLQQVRRYIDALEAEYGGAWRGHLIGGDVGATIASALSDERDYDIAAWRLERSADAATLHFVGHSAA